MGRSTAQLVRSIRLSRFRFGERAGEEIGVWGKRRSHPGQWRQDLANGLAVGNTSCRERIVTRMGRNRIAGSVRVAHRAVRQRRLAQISAGQMHKPSIITKMNRTTRTDSKLSLDRRVLIGDSSRMVAQPYHLYIERTDPAKNMARYYAMEISGTLFGEVCLTRAWGRIGSRGQSKVHHFGREEEAVSLFLELMRRKRARGYHPRSIPQQSGN